MDTLNSGSKIYGKHDVLTNIITVIIKLNQQEAELKKNAMTMYIHFLVSHWLVHMWQAFYVYIISAMKDIFLGK